MIHCSCIYILSKKQIERSFFVASADDKPVKCLARVACHTAREFLHVFECVFDCAKSRTSVEPLTVFSAETHQSCPKTPVAVKFSCVVACVGVELKILCFQFFHVKLRLRTSLSSSADRTYGSIEYGKINLTTTDGREEKFRKRRGRVVRSTLNQ